LLAAHFRLVTLLTAVVVASTGLTVLLLVSNPLLATYTVEGPSMQPTLRCGGAPGCTSLRSQRIFVSGLPFLFTAPSRGDIVVLTLREHACGGNGTLVKRIIGGPGDIVSERRGRIMVDGKSLVERYVPESERDRGSFRPLTLSSNQYFVMGDNRAVSCDSRTFGPINRSAIRGKVIDDLGFLS
jgi:signal peptidase I